MQNQESIVDFDRYSYILRTWSGGCEDVKKWRNHCRSGLGNSKHRWRYVLPAGMGRPSPGRPYLQYLQYLYYNNYNIYNMSRLSEINAPSLTVCRVSAIFIASLQQTRPRPAALQHRLHHAARHHRACTPVVWSRRNMRFGTHKDWKWCRCVLILSL